MASDIIPQVKITIYGTSSVYAVLVARSFWNVLYFRLPMSIWSKFFFIVTGLLSAQACEGSTLNIKCDNGRINVISANYGRLSKTECNPDGRRPVTSANCKAGGSFGIVKLICNNQRRCTVQATNGIFTDPCYGTHKYLDVKYSCSQTGKLIEKLLIENFFFIISRSYSTSDEHYKMGMRR